MVRLRDTTQHGAIALTDPRGEEHNLGYECPNACSTADIASRCPECSETLKAKKTQESSGG